MQSHPTGVMHMIPLTVVLYYFGLPKQLLVDTKCAIDNIAIHLIGKTIRMVDACLYRAENPLWQ